MGSRMSDMGRKTKTNKSKKNPLTRPTEENSNVSCTQIEKYM
jgi:hypothetical protein